MSRHVPVFVVIDAFLWYRAGLESQLFPYFGMNPFRFFPISPPSKVYAQPRGFFSLWSQAETHRDLLTPRRFYDSAKAINPLGANWQMQLCEGGHSRRLQLCQRHRVCQVNLPLR
jgi:hypothetical protein